MCYGFAGTSECSRLTAPKVHQGRKTTQQMVYPISPNGPLKVMLMLNYLSYSVYLEKNGPLFYVEFEGKVQALVKHLLRDILLLEYRITPRSMYIMVALDALTG